jgi:hypothetical protein
MGHINRSPKRDSDERKANLVNEFLDKNLYREEFGFSNFSRIDEKEKQVAGIDVMFNLNGEKYVCDEKAAVGEKYVNGNLMTFCMELSMKNQGGILQKGWFVNEKMVNDSYLIVWIDKAERSDFKSSDEIIEAEVVLFRKKDLYDYLERNGMEKDKIIRQAERMVREGTQYTDYIIDGVKFVQSLYLTEKPVNLIINREIYRNINKLCRGKRSVVTKEGLKFV